MRMSNCRMAEDKNAHSWLERVLGDGVTLKIVGEDGAKTVARKVINKELDCWCKLAQ